MKTTLYHIKSGEIFTFSDEKQKESFPNTYIMLHYEFFVDLTSGQKFDALRYSEDSVVNKLTRFVIER